MTKAIAIWLVAEATGSQNLKAQLGARSVFNFDLCSPSPWKGIVHPPPCP